VLPWAFREGRRVLPLDVYYSGWRRRVHPAIFPTVLPGAGVARQNIRGWSSAILWRAGFAFSVVAGATPLSTSLNAAFLFFKHILSFCAFRDFGAVGRTASVCAWTRMVQQAPAHSIQRLRWATRAAPGVVSASWRKGLAFRYVPCSVAAALLAWGAVDAVGDIWRVMNFSPVAMFTSMVLREGDVARHCVWNRTGSFVLWLFSSRTCRHGVCLTALASWFLDIASLYAYELSARRADIACFRSRLAA
jgi:hypothetical protein